MTHIVPDSRYIENEQLSQTQTCYQLAVEGFCGFPCSVWFEEYHGRRDHACRFEIGLRCLQHVKCMLEIVIAIFISIYPPQVVDKR